MTMLRGLLVRYASMLDNNPGHQIKVPRILASKHRQCLFRWEPVLNRVNHILLATIIGNNVEAVTKAQCVIYFCDPMNDRQRMIDFCPLPVNSLIQTYIVQRICRLYIILTPHFIVRS
jgi:hypothetical protein